MKIPVKADGGLWFTTPRRDHPNLEWEEAEGFDAELKLVSYQQTSQGGFFLWADTDTNSTYPMSPEEMYNTVVTGQALEEGQINGSWEFVKTADGNFSIHLVEDLGY